MSEQGWKDFLGADGVEDWVVLHGGPTAVFRVGSLVEAARLAEAIAVVPGLEPRTAMSVLPDRLTVRLTREMWGIEERHVALARAISALAAGGRIVDESEAPGGWILADRSGNKVCIASWPDGAVAAASAEPPPSE